MPKKENLEYLASEYIAACKSQKREPTISLDDYEALLKVCFGEKRTVARFAYTTYTHQIAGTRGYSKIPRPKRDALREEVVGLIVRCVDDLLASNLSGREEFDTWNHNTCEEIRAESKKHKIQEWIGWMVEGFPYGTAQIMLNLTIEYMLVMEQWDNQLDPIRKYLHIPVYYKTMKAASEEFQITMPCKNGEIGVYSLSGGETASKEWGRWDYSEYAKFQEDVRNAVDCPMKWNFSICNKPNF